MLLPATVSGVNAQNSEKQNMNQMSGFPGGGMSTGGSMPNGGRIPSGGMNMRGER